MRDAPITDVLGITAPEGFYAAGGVCGIKASGQPDLAVIVADRACSAAGVFTTSRTLSPSVEVCRRHLRGGRAQAVVVNSGVSNASTGEQGRRDAAAMAAGVSRALASGVCERLGKVDVPPKRVLMASTGVIGHPLPMDKIAPGIDAMVTRLARGPAADAAAARAIMTTDLVPKTAYREVRVGGGRCRVAGITKGSGMIAPNMATMLAFVTTDADVAPGPLKRALRAAAAASFNRTSVDAHTSPSDTVLVLSYPSGKHEQVKAAEGAAYEAFAAALTDLCRDLAYQIIKDGEGATKVLRVRVTGARSEKDADRVGRAVVDSPLVKTAVHGGDPNWGRVITAAGYSGARVEEAAMALTIKAVGEKGGGVTVFRHGAPARLTDAQTRRLEASMRQKEVVFTLDLGQGETAVEWLGCDLSRQYITINADYTT